MASMLQELYFSVSGVLTLKEVLLGLGVFYVVYRVFDILRSLQATNHLPGLRVLFDPLSLGGAFLPTSSWNPGTNFQWDQRLSLYSKYKRDTISMIPLAFGSGNIWTRDIDVARVVAGTSASSHWIKPRNFSRALLLFGMNLAAAEGGESWRNHRRIMSPAFNNKTYEAVWNESIRVYKSMIDCEGWAKKGEIVIPVMQNYTYKFALFIISACGFGLPFQWDEPPIDRNGKMSVQEALETVSAYNLLRIILPRRAFYLPIKKLRHIEEAHQTLNAYMHEQIAERRADLAGENEGDKGTRARTDVFSRLVAANAEEAGKNPLSDQELIGNTFVLLFAGHDTSGSTLAATLGFLAIYQDQQELVYQNIINVLGHDHSRDPAFADFDALYVVLAAFYEALRLIPAGSVMIREATQDTTLPIARASDAPNDGTVPEVLLVKKGSMVFVDMIGIQYNPKYFPDPHEYRSSRWYDKKGAKEFEAFTAFSFGPRACIGRRLAMTEAVCWLSLFLRDWQVHPVLLESEGEGEGVTETTEQWRERVMQAKLVMTLTMGDVPVRLTRRHPAQTPSD